MLVAAAAVMAQEPSPPSIPYPPMSPPMPPAAPPMPPAAPPMPLPLASQPGGWIPVVAIAFSVPLGVCVLFGCIIFMCYQTDMILGSGARDDDIGVEFQYGGGRGGGGMGGGMGGMGPDGSYNQNGRLQSEQM